MTSFLREAHEKKVQDIGLEAHEEKVQDIGIEMLFCEVGVFAVKFYNIRDPLKSHILGTRKQCKF